MRQIFAEYLLEEMDKNEKIIVVTADIGYGILDKLRNNKETYEQIIINLMRLAEEQRRKQEELMIEGCKEMYNDMLEITKEWESTDAELDWEWKDGS